jgi:hypothetical protein
MEIELERLDQALSEPENMKSAELWAEEVAARSFPDEEREWSEDKVEGRVTKLLTGYQISIKGDERRGYVVLRAENLSTGQEDKWSSLKKYIPSALDKACASLNKSGWKVTERSGGSYSLNVLAEISVDVLQTNAVDACVGVANCISGLKLK